MTNFKAHNLKVVGSNPTPATKKNRRNLPIIAHFGSRRDGRFLRFWGFLSRHYRDIYSYASQIMLDRNDQSDYISGVGAAFREGWVAPALRRKAYA